MRITKQSEKTGLPPGALIYVGEKISESSKVSIISYGESYYEEKTGDEIELPGFGDNEAAIRWINVDGLGHVELLKKLGCHFGLHPLTLEDILNTDQRPKTETFERYIYTVIKMLSYNDVRNSIETEQISLICGDGFVLSFQENEGDVLDPVRERIRHNKGTIRKMGADYLAYSLLDAIVDEYFAVLEKLGERIEDLEDMLVPNPSREILHEVHRLKREMIFMRRAIWPLREVVGNLEKHQLTFFTETTGLYLRDVYDHIVQIIETTEIYREMLSGILDIYLSSVNNKMNEVMKVLTIIATIFIPLTFISGVYGMNFRFMPELNWVYGYPLVLALMLAVMLTMLTYFKRKKWF